MFGLVYSCRFLVEDCVVFIDWWSDSSWLPAFLVVLAMGGREAFGDFKASCIVRVELEGICWFLNRVLTDSKPLFSRGSFET